jgi:hypothetical protein
MTKHTVIYLPAYGPRLSNVFNKFMQSLLRIKFPQTPNWEALVTFHFSYYTMKI